MIQIDYDRMHQIIQASRIRTTNHRLWVGGVRRG